MSRITRVNQKVFASDAGINELSKFGSLAEGAPSFTTDPTVMQSLSSFTDGWFASVIGNNSPAMEDMNTLHHLITRQLAYLLQQGIPEYDALTEYSLGSRVSDDLNTYRSLSDGNIGNGVSDTSKWRKIVDNDTNSAKSSAALVAVTNPVLGTTLPGRSWSILLQGLLSPLVIAVGSDGGAAAGSAYTSTDGVAWTSRTIAALAANWKTGVSAISSVSTNLFVVAGLFSLTTNKIVTTNDGVTWTERTLPTYTGSVLEHSAVGTVASVITFVFSDYNGRLLVSSNDGVTWVAHNMGLTATQNISKLFYSSILSKFIAGVYDSSTSTSSFYSSTNGTTWTLYSTPVFPAGLVVNTYTVIENGSFFLANISTVLGASEDIWISSDLITWKRSVNGASEAGGYIGRMSSAGEVGPDFEGVVICPCGGGVMASYDGMTWFNSKLYLNPSIIKWIYQLQKFVGISLNNGDANKSLATMRII